MQRRHGAADRGADKDHGRQQDRGLAAVDVGDDAPKDRTGDGADQGEEGHEGGDLFSHAVFLDEPRHDKTERGRFHDIDDQGHDQYDHEHDMRRAQFCIFRGGYCYARGGADLLPDTLGEQAIGGHADACHDQEHAEQHAVIHRHTGHGEAHVLRHPEHRKVQQNADSHHGAAEGEGPNAASAVKNTSVHMSVPLQLFFLKGYAQFAKNKALNS